MGLPQAARWKAASNREVASLEKHGVYELIPIVSVPTGQRVIGTLWVSKVKADGTKKSRLVVRV